jgi:hypothetical protein
MIEEHCRATDAMRHAATISGVPAPVPSISDQSRLLAALQSLRGTEFDRTYIRQQVLAHRQALAVDESYAGRGTNPNLREAGPDLYFRRSRSISEWPSNCETHLVGPSKRHKARAADSICKWRRHPAVGAGAFRLLGCFEPVFPSLALPSCPARKNLSEGRRKT